MIGAALKHCAATGKRATRSPGRPHSQVKATICKDVLTAYPSRDILSALPDMSRGGESGLENRLRVLRAERGWSQAELGGRLGVSRQAVNAIETGKHDPSLTLAFKLARLFAQPIEGIFDDGGSHG
jgi:putative transcriptional regulator